jgi:hypothetical protein
MKHSFIVLLFVLALPSFALADAAKIPADLKKVLADVSRFREIHSSTNLPPALVALCADKNGRFAEPGQAFNATDSIMDTSVPGSRLVWAATDGEYYVVHFERGGIAHTFELLVATMDPESRKPTVVLHCYVGRLLKNYGAFIREMEAGRIRCE